MWRLTYSPFLWLAYNLVTLVLQVVGFLLVPIAIWKAVPTISPITGKAIVTAPRWLWLFGNDEDGYNPEWYEVYELTWPWWWRQWVWAAWRNPVNNLRFVTWLHPPPVVGKVHYRTYWRFTFLWQGWATRLVWISPKGHWLTVGWKYWIDDATVPCTDWRRFGVGFGTRWA